MAAGTVDSFAVRVPAGSVPARSALDSLVGSLTGSQLGTNLGAVTGAAALPGKLLQPIRSARRSFPLGALAGSHTGGILHPLGRAGRLVGGASGALIGVPRGQLLPGDKLGGILGQQAGLARGVLEGRTDPAARLLGSTSGALKGALRGSVTALPKLLPAQTAGTAVGVPLGALAGQKNGLAFGPLKWISSIKKAALAAPQGTVLGTVLLPGGRIGRHLGEGSGLVLGTLQRLVPASTGLAISSTAGSLIGLLLGTAADGLLGALFGALPGGALGRIFTVLLVMTPHLLMRVIPAGLFGGAAASRLSSAVRGLHHALRASVFGALIGSLADGLIGSVLHGISGGFLGHLFGKLLDRLLGAQLFGTAASLRGAQRGFGRGLFGDFLTGALLGRSTFRALGGMGGALFGALAARAHQKTAGAAPEEPVLVERARPEQPVPVPLQPTPAVSNVPAADEMPQPAAEAAGGRALADTGEDPAGLAAAAVLAVFSLLGMGWRRKTA